MRTESELYKEYSVDEKHFLERMFTVYPKIGENFDRYLSTPPVGRLLMLRQDMTELKRAGWVKRGVKNPENVADHSVTAARMGIFFTPKNMGIDSGKLVSMLMFHDAPEAIVTDFTPHDGILEQDKHRLEALAARAIFPEHPQLPGNKEAVVQINEYIAQETKLSHWAHDLDKLDAVITAIMYEDMYPAQQGKLFRPFADYTAPKLKTDQGKTILQGLEKDFEQMRADWRENTRNKKEKMVWSR